MNIKQTVVIVALFGVVALTFQNCTPVKVVSSTSSPSFKSDGGDDPLVSIADDGAGALPDVASMPGVSSQPGGPEVVASTEECAEFIDQAPALPEHGSCDKNKGASPKSGDIKITGESADVVVDSAASASLINGNSGNIYINAGKIGKVNGNSSDEICLRADSIESMAGNSAHITAVANSIGSLNGFNGDLRITAKSIGVINGGSGTMHIYRAQIARANGLSGTLCLHDGARLLSSNGSSAQVRTDCAD